jgi:hypothetical protein
MGTVYNRDKKSMEVQMMQKLEPPKCVMCSNPMEHQYGNEKISFPFCNHAQCPNYGLLQTEVYPREKKDDKE